MNALPTYDHNEFPWEIIVASFQGGLTPAEEMQLQAWLSLSPDNVEKYAEWHKLWMESLADYTYYQQADAEAGWRDLQERLLRKGVKDTGIYPGRQEEAQKKEELAKVMHVSFKSTAKQWMTAAAVILVMVSGGWWYFNRSGDAMMYETASGQKNITLSDGSTVLLQPKTHIRIEGGYNKRNRTVTLASGTAFFEVRHQETLPFIVVLGSTSVRDIGTSFTISRMLNNVEVSVQKGKVAFIRNANGENHELSAGMSLSFDSGKEQFGAIIRNTVSDTIFHNTPLADIITAVEKLYGKHIILDDSSLSRKKLTINMGGESFENTMQVLCTALSITVEERNGTYLLKKK